MRESCSVQLIKTYQLIKPNLPRVSYCMEFYQEAFGLYCYYWQIRCIKPVHWKDLLKDSFDTPHNYTDATFPIRVDVSLCLLLGHLL